MHRAHSSSWAPQIISPAEGDRLLNITILIAGSMSLAITLLVLALVREIRLRRGLQQLLAKLLAHWRNQDANDHTLD